MNTAAWRNVANRWHKSIADTLGRIGATSTRTLGRTLSVSLITATMASMFAAVTLAGCGFQLRGDHNYPFKRLYIVGETREMKSRLTRMIEAGSDTRVVDYAKDADATLAVSTGRGQNSLSFDINGVTLEYQLTTTLSYTLTAKNGAILIPPSTISVNRAMSYGTTYALAKGTEADQLYRDMDLDIVDQLLRRLEVVQSMSPAATPVPGVRLRSPLPTPPL